MSSGGDRGDNGRPNVYSGPRTDSRPGSVAPYLDSNVLPGPRQFPSPGSLPSSLGNPVELTRIRLDRKGGYMAGNEPTRQNLQGRLLELEGIVMGIHGILDSIVGDGPEPDKNGIGNEGCVATLERVIGETEHLGKRVDLLFQAIGRV